MDVVFIVLDSLRRDRLSVYNSDIDFTSNIEEFAESAHMYENAVSQAPWTLPAHASIFTGEYPWEHGATQKNPKLETDTQTLAGKFRNEGYRTACYSYNAFLSDPGLTKGFDEVDNFTGSAEKLIPDFVIERWNNWLVSDGFDRLKRLIQRTGFRIFHSRFSKTSDAKKVLSRAKKFINSSRDADDNFFLFINLMEVHEPYYPEEEYRQKHAPDVDPSDICQDPTKHLSGRKGANFDAISKVYNACVDQLDDRLGEFFEFLEQDGIDEDTLVVVTSDHGQLLGEEDLYGHQFSVREELMHVPLIVKRSGKDSRRVEEQVELRQLYHLIPEWTGIEDGETEVGIDLALGGYEFPDLAIKLIPDKLRQKFYRRLRFVRGEGRKLTESMPEQGETKYRMINLGSEEEIDVEERFKQEIEQTGETESEGELEAGDEIKDRLEALGYM